MQLRLQPAAKVELARLAHEHVDGAGRKKRLGVEDHQLLLDTDAQRRGLAEVRLDQRGCAALPPAPRRKRVAPTQVESGTPGRRSGPPSQCSRRSRWPAAERIAGLLFTSARVKSGLTRQAGTPPDWLL